MKEFNNSDHDIERDNRREINANKSSLNISGNLDLIFDDPVKKDYYLYLEENHKKLSRLLSELLDRIELNRLQNSELSTEITELKKAKDDLEKEIEEIKNQKSALNLTKNDIKDLVDKSPLQMIMDSIYSQDLIANTELGKKIGRLDYQQVEEAKMMLSGNCGKYIKTIGSLICYLKKLSAYYREKQEISANSAQENSDKSNASPDAEPNSERQLLNNAKAANPNGDLEIDVTYQSKLVSFSIMKELKGSFTFENLRSKCCEYWNIPESSFCSFFIMSNKQIFNHKDKVYEIIKNAAENNFKHNLELIDKKFILENRTKLEEHLKGNNHDEFDLIAKLQEKRSNSGKSNNDKKRNYFNDIDEYECEESIWELTKEFFFGNPDLKEKLKDEETKFENDFKKILEKRRQKELNDGYDESEEERLQRENDELLEKKEMHQERLTACRKKFYKRRKLKPLLLTPFDVFKFRFKSFLSLVLYVFFIFRIFRDSQLGNADINFLTECYNSIKKAFFLNQNFKNFLHKRDLKGLEPNDLISDKRDLNNYLLFVLNNIVTRGNDTAAFGMGKYDQSLDSNFFIVNTIKFTFKYTSFQKENNLSRTISEKIYSQNYPVRSEFKEKTERNSYQKVNITWILNDNETFQVGNYSTNMFPNFRKVGEEERLYFKAKNTTPTYVSGVITNYKTEGFDVFLNLDYTSRLEYDEIVSHLIHDFLLLDNVSYMKLTLNYYNPVFNVLLKVDFIVEFSILGYNITNVAMNILDIAVGNEFVDSLITYSSLYMYLFLLSHIYKFIFMKYMEKKDPYDPELVNRSQFLWDTICFTLLILTNLFKAMNIASFKEELISKVSKIYKDYPKKSDPDLDWMYLDVRGSLLLNSTYNMINSMLIIMFAMRVFFYLQQSPLIKFFLNYYSVLLKSIFNLFVVLIVFILCYSLVIHVLAGQKSLIMSDLMHTIIVALRFILKMGDGKLFADFIDIYRVINIIFTFLIVNFGYVFLFSYVKEIYYQEMIEYKQYLSQKENKVIGDYFEFVKSSVMLSLYFWYSTFKKLKKENYTPAKGEKFNLDKFDSSKDFDMIALSYQKRDVYFVYPKKYH